MTMTASSTGADPNPQINLFQVRGTTPKPNVTWQSPVTISDASDVSALGDYFGSWAPQDGGANNFPASHRGRNDPRSKVFRIPRMAHVANDLSPQIASLAEKAARGDRLDA